MGPRNWGVVAVNYGVLKAPFNKYACPGAKICAAEGREALPGKGSSGTEISGATSGLTFNNTTPSVRLRAEVARVAFAARRAQELGADAIIVPSQEP